MHLKMTFITTNVQVTLLCQNHISNKTFSNIIAWVGFHFQPPKSRFPYSKCDFVIFQNFWKHVSFIFQALFED